MQKILTAGLIVSTFACGLVPALAQSSLYIPKPGSPERKAIMNALRGPVVRDLKVPVVFVVDDPADDFRAMQNWVFVDARFVPAPGRRMPGRDVNPSESDDVCALLHRVHGQWHVVTHVTGATDVEWENWGRRYHAPAAIFPPH